MKRNPPENECNEGLKLVRKTEAIIQPPCRMCPKLLNLRGKTLVKHLQEHLISFNAQKRAETDKDLMYTRKLAETISFVESFPNRYDRRNAIAQTRGERYTDCVDTFLPSNDSLACAYATVAVCMLDGFRSVSPLAAFFS